MAGTVGQARGIRDVYDFHQSNTNLGVGSFGQVRGVKNKSTGDTFAVKQISRRQPNAKMEVEVMKMLDHMNIVKLVEHFEDSCDLYLAMELCNGGKIINFVAQTQDFKESDVAVMMRQVFSAVNYMHGKNIVHRDIKPDNMLFESWCAIPQNTLKLIDFGLSCKCSPGQTLRLVAGTTEYMSPQVIVGHYNSQTDLWSCGVVMYMLLCGYVPFRASTDSGVIASVQNANFTFVEKDWQNISANAKDLIRALLKFDSRDRPTAEIALGHAWTRQRYGDVGNGQLEGAIRQFKLQSTRRQHQQTRAAACEFEYPHTQADVCMFSDVRTAWDQATKWASGLFLQLKSEV